MSVTETSRTINYYIQPRWVCSPGGADGGWPYFAACEVETGRLLADADDRDEAARRAEERFQGAVRMSNTESGWVAADRAVHA